MNDNPYAPPPELELGPCEPQYPTTALWALTFGIAGIAGISVLTDLPSIVSPFPILPLILREGFDVPIPLISVIAGVAFAITHVRHITGRPKQQPSNRLTIALALMTILSVPYFYIDFSLGIAVRGMAHTLVVSGYNAFFAIATWSAWFRSRAPGRYRSQVMFGTLLFAWMFWCGIPYLGDV